MRPFGFWPVWALTVILATGPTALALVVVNEDFEDDTPSSYDPANSVEPGLEGLPVNNGRPGRWLPNQYDQLTWFNNPWHDDLDTNPDTNWQLQVMQDIGPPRPGNEAFYQNQHTNCELYLHCQFIEDDCSALGLSSPGPCDNDRFSRDGFIQFATWDPNANGGNGAHVPRPAVTGEKVSGRFDWVIFDGVPLFGLVDDIQAMADSTSDEDLHACAECII